MRRAGFSLIELLVVISILSVLILVTGEAVSNKGPEYRLVNAVREIQSRLNFARYRSIIRDEIIRFQFQPDGFVQESYDPEEKIWHQIFSTKLEGIGLEANNTPIFYPQGTVSNLASIFVKNSRGTYRITIAISGRVKAYKLE